MAQSNTYSMHTIALAIASALALGGWAAPAAAGEVSEAGVAEQGNRQFILMYQKGSAPSRDRAAMTSSLAAAAKRAKLPASSDGRPGLRAVRQMAVEGMRVVAVDAPLSRAGAIALMQQLAADKNVKFVQVDGGVQTKLVPNDPRFSQQWHYADTAAGIRAPTAWNTTNGAGVVVAVVDSGIMPHNDLNANILPGYDFVSSVSGRNAAECGIDGLPAGCGKSLDGDGRDSNPTDSEGNTHGNHVTGTIAAVTNNALGVAGIAYGAKIVPVRAAGSSGYNAHSDTIDAIVWASGGHVAGVPDNVNPAEVINASLGSDNYACTPAWQAGLDAARANGALVVVAAGNGNNDVSKNVPAGCNNVVAVAATDQNGAKSSFSAWGPKIGVSAPGSSVLSTVANNGYGNKSGTSMASPHVAGVAALIRAVAPSKTPAQVEAILKSTARPIPVSKCAKGCGAGLVDAGAAVVAAKK